MKLVEYQAFYKKYPAEKNFTFTKIFFSEKEARRAAEPYKVVGICING
jgi:hypothetical protein